VRLRVTRRAATQIERALDYIEAESPQGANRMRERIATLFPFAGRASLRGPSDRLSRREAPFHQSLSLSDLLPRYRRGGYRSAGAPHIAPAPLWVEAACGRSRSSPLAGSILSARRPQTAASEAATTGPGAVCRLPRQPATPRLGPARSSRAPHRSPGSAADGTDTIFQRLGFSGRKVALRSLQGCRPLLYEAHRRNIASI
jgi:plasmid stabilization system protein ParE